MKNQPQIVYVKEKKSPILVGCLGCGCLAFFLIGIVVFLSLSNLSVREDARPVVTPKNEDKSSKPPSKAGISAQNTNEGQKESAEDTTPPEPAKSDFVLRIENIDNEIKYLEQQLADSHWRTWTDQKGKTIEAAYRETFNNTEITLENREGKKFKLDVSRLSEDDQTWIKSEFPKLRNSITRKISSLRKEKQPLQEKEEERLRQLAQEAARLAKIKGVTPAGYSAIVPGMSYSEVCEILGEPGEEFASGAFGGQTTHTIVWGGGLFQGTISVTFNNGRVTAKAQAGLR
jgi:hypothetical protein